MKYNKELLNKHIEQLSDMIHYVEDNIIWEPQEGQENHFDSLNKSEKIAIIGIGNAMKLACNNLVRYKMLMN